MRAHRKDCVDVKKGGIDMSQHRCSLCGNIHNNITFKCGYVCEDCIDYIKESPRDKHQER